MNRLRRALAVASAGFCLGVTPATWSQPVEGFPSFRILQIASSQDGTAQIIEPAEVAGRNDQHKLAGFFIEVGDGMGAHDQFLLADLPRTDTANRHVLLATANLPGLYRGPIHADFVLPSGFLPTGGGWLSLSTCLGCFEPVALDVLAFGPIPVDGGLLGHNGESGQDTIQNFPGDVFNCCGGSNDGSVAPIGIDFTEISIVEYFNATLDHYFMSGSQPDLDALDSGRLRGWDRRGSFSASSRPVTYDAGDRPPIRSVPVCRYYIPSGSHFFSAAVDECRTTAQQHPEYILETEAAFYVVLPDPATGQCPPPVLFSELILGFDPVYRLWNNRPDTNHRFTDSTFQRFELIKQGRVPEGYGPLGVAMCSQFWTSPT